MAQHRQTQQDAQQTETKLLFMFLFKRIKHSKHIKHRLFTAHKLHKLHKSARMIINDFFDVCFICRKKFESQLSYFLPNI